MLILTRKLQESIVIDSHITIKVVSIGRSGVKLGVEAPAEVVVLRQELFDDLAGSMLAPGFGCRE